MKFYAVRKGRSIGLFESWEECKASVEKFPGAEYKSFALQDDAMRYLLGEDLSGKDQEKPALPAGIYFDGGTGLSAVLDELVAESNVTNEKGEALLTKALFYALPEDLRFGSFHVRDNKNTVLLKQEEGFTNNFAELYAFYLSLVIAERTVEKPGKSASGPAPSAAPAPLPSIYGDSELILKWWSRGHINVDDERTLLLAREVISLRSAYEGRGGKILKISGDDNPADLGFHK